MENGTINEILGEFLNQGLSRRDFMKALGAVGISAAGISSLLRVAGAVKAGGAHMFISDGLWIGGVPNP